MRYISVDTETTGLDPEKDQVLSIGAIIEDTNKPTDFQDTSKFHGVIKRNQITGGLYAINLNQKLLATMNQYKCAESEAAKAKIEANTGMQFYNENEIVSEFFYWLAEHDFVKTKEDDGRAYLDRHVTVRNGKMLPAIDHKTKPIQITVAGKNFATFDKLFLEKLPRWKQLIKVRQRIMDPAILFLDWEQDESLPNLATCKKRAGFQEIVTHNAVEDAWDVIQLLRQTYV